MIKFKFKFKFKFKLSASAAIFLSCIGAQANADVCDYRPSQLIGGGGAGALAGSGVAVAAGGAAMQIAGYYTLTHAVTGATMLGSTLAGASAAGTVGIIGGSAGLLGSAAAVVMAPATIIVAVVTSAGIGIYEGACFFQDERITDIVEVRAIVEGVASSADPEYFRMGDVEVFIKNIDGEVARYKIKDLYIVNGVLMNRDWFRNTTIGNIAFVTRN